jgi:radical SAM superfamily enzyme YgiQ (UPF0313 family)
MYKKVAFIVCPSQELERPPAAAAALSGVLEKNNVDYKIFDLNLDLYNKLSNNDWMTCERKWRIDSDQNLPESFYTWLDSNVNTIISYNCDLIAISVFTKFSTRFAEIILSKIRNKTSVKIIAGGQGLGTPWGDSTFGKYIWNNKQLVDHIAVGDGEIIFDRFLKDEKNIPGLDNQPPEQINNLDSIPYPSFNQLDPNSYKYYKNAGIYVTASRGCVRKCKFCDVPWRWPKYKYRKGSDVAKEMFLQYQKTKVSVFQFTDSVVNGVIPEFERLQDSLIAYKKQDSAFNPQWISQFNIRKKKDMPEHIYQKMSSAGAEVLICGVEHSSWRIREAMGKEFNDDDLDYHIRMCAKYGIKNVFLMFIGFPTETAEDHQHLLNWLEQYRVYMLCGTIMLIRWGYTGSLDHGSKLAMNYEEMNIVAEWPNLKINSSNDHIQDWIYGRNWINTNNPSLTFKERVLRRLEVHQKSVKLGYPVTRGREELEALKIICRAYFTKEDIPLLEEPGDH